MKYIKINILMRTKMLVILYFIFFKLSVFTIAQTTSLPAKEKYQLTTIDSKHGYLYVGLENHLVLNNVPTMSLKLTCESNFMSISRGRRLNEYIVMTNDTGQSIIELRKYLDKTHYKLIKQYTFKSVNVPDPYFTVDSFTLFNLKRAFKVRKVYLTNAKKFHFWLMCDLSYKDNFFSLISCDVSIDDHEFHCPDGNIPNEFKEAIANAPIGSTLKFYNIRYKYLMNENQHLQNFQTTIE